MSGISGVPSIVGTAWKGSLGETVEQFYALNGVDPKLADQYTKISLSQSNQIPTSPGPTAAERAFYDGLTPQQLQTTANVGIGGGSRTGVTFTWQQVKDYVYALSDLYDRLDALDAGGRAAGQATGALSAGSAGWSNASAAQVETSYVKTLLDGVSADRPGSLAAAQAYLARARTPTDTVTLSASAVEKLVQADADDQKAHPLGYWSVAVTDPATLTKLAVGAQSARLDAKA